MKLIDLAETKYVVSGATFIVVCWRRDVFIASFLLAAICNALLGKILKRLINASRPAGARLADPGMPSSHALSLFFFTGFLANGAFVWPLPEFEHDRYRKKGRSAEEELLLRLILSLGIGWIASKLAQLRIEAGLHTIAQVAVGAVIGFVNGTVYFHLAPHCEKRLLGLTGEFGGGGGQLLLVGLVAVGALAVGSVERTLSYQQKQPSGGGSGAAAPKQSKKAQ